MTEWEAHGMIFGNCNCGYACPCQFNALPTHGDCRAVIYVRIDEGRHGEVRLGGVRGGFIVSWPGPVHKGGGTMQPFIDRGASPVQRDALRRILTGQDTKEMATGFWVYSKMCDTIHEPVVTDVSIELDMDRRRARCRAEGLAESRGEPILNPVTGAEHRVGIHMPAGFEYERCEVGRGWSETKGRVPMRLEDSYGTWFEMHMNQDGVMRGLAKRPASLAA